jgi:hypothetical protein
MTVARFRETFPNARWSDRLQAGTVPDKTARKRIDRWLATEADRPNPSKRSAAAMLSSSSRSSADTCESMKAVLRGRL